MSHVVVSNLAYAHPGGDVLFSDVSFKVGSGQHIGFVGANGVGKSTLLKILAGRLEQIEGDADVGPFAYMPQDVGVGAERERTVREMLLELAPPRLRSAGEKMVAAERQLAAATANIGVATADLFPRVSLVGLIGFASNRLTDLGTRDSPQYSLGAGLTWPLLDFGRVRSRIAASEARAQQSLAGYEQTVAIALEETEGALAQFTRNAQQAERLASAARNAEEATRLSRLRFDAGSVDLLVVLDAQRQSLAARDALVQSQVGQATALVAIYRALGGGWTDVPAAAVAQR